MPNRNYIKGEYAVGLRSKRIMLILDAVVRSGEMGIDKDKLIAIQSIEWGVSERKMKEYIKLLANVGEIIDTKGILYYGNRQKGAGEEEPTEGVRVREESSDRVGE